MTLAVSEHNALKTRRNGVNSSANLKVFMTPTPGEATRDLGHSINHIVVRLHRHLPDYGVELVEQENDCDIRAVHAGQGTKKPAEVAHYHGIYNTEQLFTGENYFRINQHVITNLKHAKVITAPSNWIADILRRDMHVSPRIIGWGVDTEEWTPARHNGYVLWNKPRVDPVCDPSFMQELARLAPDVPFLSTFGTETGNVKITGRQPYAKMREIMQRARILLSTNVETFGIANMEALASGVPILGFRQGALAEYLQHGVHGFLAEPGDMQGLLAGLHYCIQYRERLGANGRELAKQFTWQRVAEHMAAVYHEAIEPHKGAKVSIVIPCHNYQEYVGQAIESALAQQAKFEYEVIVVLDRCTDHSAEVVDVYKARGVKALAVDNGSLSATRNDGIRAATGEYIVCLDADDRIGSPHFIQTLADALDTDRTLGVAYTRLTVMNAAGELGHLNEWPREYDSEKMVRRNNRIPSCCMFRREAWQRQGGFRPHFRYAEDAEFWLGLLGLGYTARLVTEEGWFHYRLHNKSASQVHRTGEVREPDWTKYYPWTKDNRRPFAADGRPQYGSWPSRFYNTPDVSVIIPVGKGHEKRVGDALHSVEGQTHRFWECIVVNDTGYGIDLNGWPFVREIIPKKNSGAGRARNIGAKAAAAPFLVFLDADDLLEPTFIEKALATFKQTGRYVYSDWKTDDGRGKVEVHTMPNYGLEAIRAKPAIHAVTALIPRTWFEAVGGFDETLPAYEDVDLIMKLFTGGYCGARIPEPLLIYNLDYGQRRANGKPFEEKFKQHLIDRYGDYMEGVQVCNCVEPPKGKQAMQPSDVTNTADYQEAYGSPVLVRLIEGAESAVTFRGPSTRVNYGRRAVNDEFYIWQKDYENNPEMFRRVENYAVEPVATVIPPAPPEPVEPVAMLDDEGLPPGLKGDFKVVIEESMAGARLAAEKAAPTKKKPGRKTAALPKGKRA